MAVVPPDQRGGVRTPSPSRVANALLRLQPDYGANKAAGAERWDVTDTRSGAAVLRVPEGEYRINVWKSPDGARYRVVFFPRGSSRSTALTDQDGLGSLEEAHDIVFRHLGRRVSEGLRDTTRFSRGATSRSGGIRQEATVTATNPLNGLRKPKAVAIVTRLMEPHTKGLHRDEYWKPINAIFKAFDGADLKWGVTHSAYESEDGASTMPIRKVWTIQVDFLNQNGRPDIIHVRIVAAGAGSVKDPLGVYDVTAYAV